MESFPWYASALIGVCVGIFVGFILGFVAMQRLNDIENKSNKK